MESTESTVRSDGEGVGPTGSETPIGFFAEGESHPSVQPEDSERLVPQVPPELQPDKDGNPPSITPELIRQLRGKYFTVKHVRLTDCGHLLDMVNQPKNNCETCWFNWFNSHAKLIEVADEFYRTHGKQPMIAMRGVKFVKNFLRFMATVHHFMQLEKLAKEQNVTNNQEGPTLGDGTLVTEAGEGGAVEVADQGRETEGSGVGN